MKKSDLPEHSGHIPQTNHRQNQLALLLISKARDVSQGRNVAGADSLCRCTETLIKLARLELDWAKQVSVVPQLNYISSESGWTPKKPDDLIGLDKDGLKSEIESGEAYLSDLDKQVDDLGEKDSPLRKSLLNAEATFVRAYLLALRDALDT